MKRLAVVLVAALAAVSVYAMTAPAGPEAVSPKRVAALERKVSALQRSVRTLNAFANCLNRRAAAISSYGNPGAGQGYVYVQGSQQGLTTALDLAPQGEQPTFYVAVLESSCLRSGRLGHAPRVLSKHD